MKKLVMALVWFALGATAGVWGHATWAKRQQARIDAAVAKALAAETAREPTPKPKRKLAANESKPGGTAFAYEYIEPRTDTLLPLYKLAREGDLLRQLPEIQGIDGLLVLPRPIRYVTAECQAPDALYSPQKSEVVICYETLEVLLKQGELLAKDNDAVGADFPRQYLLANLRFILMHETGHALIDLLELPITGREEDAVDQMATTLMQRFAGVDESPHEVAENLRMAANWFLARAQGQYNLDAYADEHALGEQRYFNLQCLIYGSDPAGFLSIVTDGDLPAARAQRCPAEAARVSKAWLRLLLPHVAPKYEMTEEKAERFFAEKARARERNAEASYVR